MRSSVGQLPKILVVEKIWDDIKDSATENEPTSEEIKLVKKRLASYKESPNKTRSWEDVKADYLKKK